MGRKKGWNGGRRRDWKRAWENRNVVAADNSPSQLIQPPSPPTHTMEPARLEGYIIASKYEFLKISEYHETLFFFPQGS